MIKNIPSAVIILLLFWGAPLSGATTSPQRALPASETATTATVPPSPNAYSLTLLHINDHHSHLDETTLPLQLKTASGQRESISLPVGGFPRVTEAFNQLAQVNENVIKIHAGDAVTGDLYYTLTQGRADADLMNTVCFDTFTIGNHEFDNGDAGLMQFIEFLRSGPCKTQVLSANVAFGPNSPLKHGPNADVVRPSVVLERGGQKIGLIGLTIASKTKNSSRPDKTTIFKPELATAQAEIDRLTSAGVKHIIIQSHHGYKNDVLLAKTLRGVDAIIGGDSHSLLGPQDMTHYGITPEGPYPTIVLDKDGRKICIGQAAHYAYVVGQLNLQFDTNGELQTCTGTPHLLVGDNFKRTNPSAPDLSDDDLEAVRDDVRQSGFIRLTAMDAGAENVLAPYRAQKQAFGDEVVGVVEAPLCARRVPGLRRDPTRSVLGDSCNHHPHVLAHGGDIQQLVAEAFLKQSRVYFLADIAIINAGGVRIDLAPGPVTVKDIYTVLPFRNTLTQLTLTGAQIRAALEDAIDGVLATPASTGAYPYAAGLRWTLDTGQPHGQRLSKMQIRTPSGDYEAFNPSASYSVATISFLADGKDHYKEFANVPAEYRVDVGLEYAQTFLDYVLATKKQNEALGRVATEHYSTQVFIDPDTH